MYITPLLQSFSPQKRNKVIIHCSASLWSTAQEGNSSSQGGSSHYSSCPDCSPHNCESLSVHSLSSPLPLPCSSASQPSHCLPSKFWTSYGTSFLASCPGGKGWGVKRMSCCTHSCCSAFMSQLAPLTMLNILVLFAFLCKKSPCSCCCPSNVTGTHGWEHTGPCHFDSLGREFPLCYLHSKGEGRVKRHMK